MTNNRLIGIGSAITILTALWWHEEVVGRLGRVTFGNTLSCLARIGSGDCGSLWFIGLHQENQIAGLVFWLGVCVAGVGLWRKSANNKWIEWD
jgi:hypothetical protein